MQQYIDVLKTEFREFCVQHLVLRQIDDVFSQAGFTVGDVTRSFSGERRSLVEKYYASIDWDKIETIRSFLRVIETTLLQSFIGETEKELLRATCTRCGFEVDNNGSTILFASVGVEQSIKNLIFAADGPKPEIVLSDSISNEIKIVKNAEYCLIYDHPVKSHGLLWQELVSWWSAHPANVDMTDIETGRRLYSRLYKSLDSKAECHVWKTYFKKFHDEFGMQLPALIPQVYLHYDPYTVRYLQGKKRLPRQRMDFLLLLSARLCTKL